MHTDEQYGHDLGVQLRRELEVVHAAPDLVWRLRRRQARRTWAIRAAIATPAAAAILVTTGVLGAPDRRTNSPVRLENVAYVQAQTIKALSQASQYVIHAKSTYSGGYYEQWIDKASQRYRNDVYGPGDASGAVTQDGKVHAPPAPTAHTPGPIHLIQSISVSGPEGGAQNIVAVDYDLRTWWTDRVTNLRPPSAPPDITDADSIQKAISANTVELLGNDTVDGRDTLHLRVYGPERWYRIDMWVDATTYLPVQATAVKSSGEVPEEFPASSTVTTKYSWLPRTEENLAYLVLTPPPGFERAN